MLGLPMYFAIVTYIIHSILSFCEEENWYETQANIQPGELFIFLYLFVELFVVLREY